MTNTATTPKFNSYIDVATLDKNRPRTVVFYGRVSTEHEAQLSALENQMQWYKDEADRHKNWTVVDTYIDEGITGTQAKKRPAFLKMIEDAKQGKFDLIVTREVCRFARNVIDALEFTRMLRGIGVEVYFTNDNIWTFDGNDELKLGLMATFAQEESRKVSERVKAGQRISRENKTLYGNGNILGYNLDKEHNTYIINPEDAETVRMIYDMYEQGNGCMKISKALLSAHRKNASGLVKWTAGSVSAILKNATYKGYHAYYQSQSNNYLEQKRIKNKNTDTYEYKKGNWEPIISEEQWDRCQEIRKAKYAVSVFQNGEALTHSRRNSSDLWTRKMRCSCGSKFRKNRYQKDKEGNITYNYVCYNQVNNGSRTFRERNGLDTDGFCGQTSVTAWKMDMMKEIFLKAIGKDYRQDMLTTLDVIRESYKKDSKKIHVKDNSAQIENIKRKMENLIDLLADGSIEKSEYSEMRKMYTEQIDELQAKEKQNCDSDFEKLYADISKAETTLSDKNFAVTDDFIGKSVSEITADGNRFLWHFDFSEDYSIGKGKLDFSDREKLSLITTLHRLHSSNDRRTPFKIFIIGFEEAKAFRKTQGSFLRENQWSDLTVDVYLEY